MPIARVPSSSPSTCYTQAHETDTASAAREPTPFPAAATATFTDCYKDVMIRRAYNGPILAPDGLYDTEETTTSTKSEQATTMVPPSGAVAALTAPDEGGELDVFPSALVARRNSSSDVVVARGDAFLQRRLALAVAPPESAVAAIHSIPVPAVPSRDTMRQHKEEGKLPFPSRMVYTLEAVHRGDGGAKSVRAAVECDSSDEDEDKSNSTRYALSPRTARRRAKTRFLDEGRQSLNDNALRSHHVPLVPFATRATMKALRAAPTLAEAVVLGSVAAATNTSNALRAAEEEERAREAAAAAQPLSGQHQPKKFRDAFAEIRSDKPNRVALFRTTGYSVGEDTTATAARSVRSADGTTTSYIYGRRAGGGPRGGGRSAFLGDSDAIQCWAAQVKEQPHLGLKPLRREELLLEEEKVGSSDDSALWVMTGRSLYTLYAEHQAAASRMHGASTARD